MLSVLFVLAEHLDSVIYFRHELQLQSCFHIPALNICIALSLRLYKSFICLTVGRFERRVSGGAPVLRDIGRAAQVTLSGVRRWKGLPYRAERRSVTRN